MRRPARTVLAALWLAGACGEERAEPGAAAPDGPDAVVLRATGNEPGWHMEIREEGGLRLVADYGAREVRAPETTRESGPDATTYRAATGDLDLRVVVSETPCQDTMSGERFPLAVRVELDGRTLSGCGRRPE